MIILWSSLLIYSCVVERGKRGEGEGLFWPSKLGIEETILDWSDWAEEILVEIKIESLCKWPQSLVGSMLTIEKMIREKRGS